MANMEAPVGETATNRNGARAPTVGLVLGALGVFTAVWTFFLIVPGIVFGVAAIVLGVRARRRAASEKGSVAIALGVVALLLVPSVLVLVNAAEGWGRDCTLYPNHPDC